MYSMGSDAAFFFHVPFASADREVTQRLFVVLRGTLESVLSPRCLA
jgi:hypothetical protein